MLCIFNLSPEMHRVGIKGAGALAVGQGAEHHPKDRTMTLHPNGFAIMEAAAGVEVSDPARATSPAL